MTAKQEEQVIDLLSDGFGVEDIALRLKVDLRLVRFFIAKLRAKGLLDEIFGDKP